METLREKQSKFARMVSALLDYAYIMGYEVTFGDAYRDPRCSYGHKDSLHRLRLAIDLNLFKDGEYLSDTEDHKKLGKFWKALGGSWGGEWGDGNHYSLENNGMK